MKSMNSLVSMSWMTSGIYESPNHMSLNEIRIVEEFCGFVPSIYSINLKVVICLITVIINVLMLQKIPSLCPYMWKFAGCSMHQNHHKLLGQMCSSCLLLAVSLTALYPFVFYVLKLECTVIWYNIPQCLMVTLDTHQSHHSLLHMIRYWLIESFIMLNNVSFSL